jgi:hypothetical protein
MFLLVPHKGVNEMVTLTDLTNAYDNLAAATAAAFETGETAANAKRTLEVAHADALTAGLIDGKNTEQREAQARQILVEEFIAQEVASTAARCARHDLDLARIEVERVRAILRLAEWTAAVRETE